MATLKAKDDNNQTNHENYQLQRCFFCFVPAHPLEEDNLHGTMYIF